MPVVDHYRQQNKVEEVSTVHRLCQLPFTPRNEESWLLIAQIDSSPTVDQVYAQVRQALDKRLATTAGAAIVA
jgi:hypothetical protein